MHRIIHKGLEQVNTINEQGGLNWNLPYAGQSFPVTILLSFCFIIGDTEMHDHLCGRYSARTSGVSCICRHCDCPTEDIVNPQAAQAATLFRPDLLDPDDSDHDAVYFKGISHYPIYNAFHKLCFGANEHGIHMATPGETLHMHQKGAMVRAVEGMEFVVRNKDSSIVDNDVAATSKKVKVTESIEALNFLGHQYGALLSRKSDRSFPRTKFRNSLFSTAKKAGHEHAGVCLNLLLAMVSDRGRQILLENRTLEDRFLEDQVTTFEYILGLERWLKKRSYRRTEIQHLQEGFDHYVDFIKDTIKRKGMGAKLIKNHLMLHVPHYISLWGPPSGWDSGPSESHHKTEVKVPAKNTQRHQSSFIRQLSLRYYETKVIRTAERRFGLSKPTSNLHQQSQNGGEASNYQITTGGSSYTIGLNHDLHPAFRWENRQYTGRNGHPQRIIDSVCHIFLPIADFSEEKEHLIEGFTEMKVMVGNTTTQIYRAHPCYRSATGQVCDVWYDWAYFGFQGKKTSLPGQILGFIRTPRLKSGEHKHRGRKIFGNTDYALVQLFQKKPASIREGHMQREDGEFVDYCNLIKWGDVDRSGLYLLPCTSIVKPVVVVPNIACESLIIPTGQRKRRKPDVICARGVFFVVYNQDQWADFFSKTILQESESEEEESDSEEEDSDTE